MAAPVESRVEDVAGIEGLIAAKGVGRAVKAIGPRSNSHVYDGAGLPAVLRLGIFLQVELLDGIDGEDRGPIRDETRRTRHRSGVIETGIDDPVHHPSGFIGT